MRKTDAEKKRSEHNHGYTHRERSPRRITVANQSAEEIIPPPALPRKTREACPLAVFCYHHNSRIALVPHLAQHGSKLLVGLRQELVLRLPAQPTFPTFSANR